MIWPIFRPDDTHFTNPADTDSPFKDFEAERDHIAQHIAAVVAASGTSGDPQGYAQTVARGCSPMSYPTRWERPRFMALPPATAGRWPTTHPKR